MYLSVDHTCRASSQPTTQSTESTQSGAAASAVSGSGSDQQTAKGGVEEADATTPWQVSYIPVFCGSHASFARHQQQQHEATAAPTAAGCDGARAAAAAAATAADGNSKQDTLAPTASVPAATCCVVGGFDLMPQQSLHLALEQSSADCQPQSLDTFVAVMGAAPGWLCAATNSSSGGAECCWDSSRLGAGLGAGAAEAGLLPPQHIVKLCVTVSTVSTERDSLATVPLRLPAPARGSTFGPAMLVESRHLGEFCCK